MSLARKIFSNTAWQFTGKAATAVLGIISIKFITNYLSPTMYGEYTTIYDYTALFAIIADFGLFTIAVREMAHAADKKITEKIVGNVLGIRAALAVGAFALAILAAYAIPAYHGSHIPRGVMIVSVATFFTLIAGTMSSVLQFSLRMMWASVGLTIGKLITVAYIVTSIVYIFPNAPEKGFPHLLFAWILGSCISLIITYFAARRIVPVRFQFDFPFWKNVFSKALPYGLALVLGTMYFRMGTIVLSLFGMQEQIGFYGVPLRFLEILQILPHYFMNSVLPVLTLRIKTAPHEGARVVRHSLNVLALLAFPMLVGGALLAWPITAAVSSPEFLTQRTADGFLWGSDLALKILLVGLTGTYLHVVLSYALVAMGRQSEILAVNAVVVLINLSLNIILAPRFGFIGASVAAALTEGCMLVFLALRLRRHIRDIWDFSFFAKVGLSAAAMGIVIFISAQPLNALLYSSSLFILIPLGAAVYAGALFITKAITKETLSRFFKPTGEISFPRELPPE
ncbi:flippase [Candidatus Peregrinibacteria bacterium]|nr:flippase [Candidatus Peregrinibacteria bacterium]